jgi:hypothetical protein
MTCHLVGTKQTMAPGTVDGLTTSNKAGTSISFYTTSNHLVEGLMLYKNHNDEREKYI